ncbi:MAG: dTDP-glucose 4,6-dehydratase [Methanobrevibacter sp.]|nr:dTDP-glucose 4,6-dehydratase [Methanobrevibacter sp.]
MKILVTGGAGFIGSNFIHYMLSKYDYEIINLDALTYCGNLENLKEIENYNNYKFIHGNINDKNLVLEILRDDVNIIVNFAAESHVDRSIDSPNIFVKTNVLGTQTLLDLANTQDIDKYIQISTDEVYGSLPKEGYFTEKTPLNPNSPYSASKAGADLLVRAYNETYGLKTNITRCSNNYGPYQYPEKLIPLMINKALANEPLPIYGDGLNIRDWIHVHDHCTAIDLVLNKGKPGEVYNVGASNEKTNMEIVELILKTLNKPKSLINFVEDRLGHDRRYAIDSTKIQGKLRWKPKYTFETGIKETIEWYLNNREWTDSVNN